MSKRLFIALPIPPNIASTIHTWQQQQSIAKARAVPANNLHLTLAFLGEQHESHINSVGSALATICCQPWLQSLDQCGLFQRAKVAYLAPKKAAPELLQLATEIQQTMGKIISYRPQQQFIPHVTVFRQFTGSSNDLWLQQQWNWPVSHFALYHSLHGNYHLIEQWPLHCSH